MKADQYKRVMAVIDAVMDAETDERKALLSEMCAGDDVLLADAEELLRQNTAAESFMEEFPTLAIPAAAMIGKTIGSYRIMSELGAGGMGAVYLAERSDGAFEQKVALKLIKRGMDSDAIQKHFINERQILASLEHPNIAHLIDGGATHDDLPFFVMEYVEGETIVDYAASKDLDLEKRLELFRKVCSAVSYAHQNLVIHRDLKPSNILVTKAGTPKLLDFGIAKLLKSDTSDGQSTRNFIFTPEYASPEQVRGEKLTTASDVYSLGVILYELLTGNRPYNTGDKNISDIIRAICETEPERPSSVLSRPQTGPNSTGQNKERTNPRPKPQALRGDLDNIILKALRKEPERRYSSVEQFSEDIRLHLAGLPVLAIKDTFSYRTSKFVRRNSGAAAAAAVILLTLIGGLSATLYQARIAQMQRLRAEQRFNDVRQLTNSFMFEVNEAIKTSPIKARELLVQRAVEYIDKLATEEGNDAALQADLATAYERIGDIQSELFKPNTGKSSEALSSHQKALAIRQELFDRQPSENSSINLSSSNVKIGDLLMISGRITDARERYETAVRILDPVLNADPNNNRVRGALASRLAALGQVIVRSGSLKEALAAYERSLGLFEEIRLAQPNYQNDRNVGIVLSFIGFVREEMGQDEEAARCYGEWLKIEQQISAMRPDDVATMGHLSTAYVAYAFALSPLGHPDEVRQRMERGVAIQERLFEKDENNFGERLSLADDQLEFGKVLLTQGSPAEARRYFEQALAHYEAVSKNDPKDLWAKRRVSCTRRWIGEALLQNGTLDLAFDRLNRSLKETNELTAAHPDYSEWQLDLALCHLRLGELHLKRNANVKVVQHLRQSLPILERLSTESPDNVKRQRDVDFVRSLLRKATA